MSLIIQTHVSITALDAGVVAQGSPFNPAAFATLKHKNRNVKRRTLPYKVFCRLPNCWNDQNIAVLHPFNIVVERDAAFRSPSSAGKSI